MRFTGHKRTFSTLNEAQYAEIDAFWDAMAARFGRENLRGLGFGWTGTTIEYAIGLKRGRLAPDACPTRGGSAGPAARKIWPGSTRKSTATDRSSARPNALRTMAIARLCTVDTF